MPRLDHGHFAVVTTFDWRFDRETPGGRRAAAPIDTAQSRTMRERAQGE
jgi:hypothetical protein